MSIIDRGTNYWPSYGSTVDCNRLSLHIQVMQLTLGRCWPGAGLFDQYEYNYTLLYQLYRSLKSKPIQNFYKGKPYLSYAKHFLGGTI